MMTMTSIYCLLLLPLVSYVIATDTTVKVNDIMGTWVNGKYTPAQTCPQGVGIKGYRVKKWNNQRMPAIEMMCKDGSILAATSRRNQGTWDTWKYCEAAGTNGVVAPGIVTGFNLRSGNAHYGSTMLKMSCSNGKKLGPSGVEIGEWSVPGDDVYSGCPTTATFCGFSAEVSWDKLGNVKFLCCSPTVMQQPGLQGYAALGQDICIGAKGDNFGFFKLPKSGILLGMKLIWKDGGVTCKATEPQYFSRFGCNHHTVSKAFSIYVTTVRDEVLLPDEANPRHPNNHKYYTVIGHDARTADNFTLNAANPSYVIKAEEIRIWYGEDMGGHRHRRHENDNGDSKVCVDVYGKFVE